MIDSWWAAAIDNTVITVCWAVSAIFSPRIVPFEHTTALSRALVAIACAWIAFARLVPIDNYFAMIANVVASYLATNLLAAAQADEGELKFKVRLAFVGGVLPRVQWIASAPPPTTTPTSNILKR